MQYSFNKGINRPLEFKGIRAQYLVYMVVGLVALLFLFALLYLIGVTLYLVLPVIGTLGTLLFSIVGKYSKKYGVHGLGKQAGFKALPKALKTRTMVRLFKDL
ncbi:DUF4133 domain-containing protein [Rhizosphaericola mali]|uniref:DUF4133 domain-containing protein n=1 Tax=Rhizosphaericola mali TaxID=2545455 RepID=A0A5P2G6W9_9BACT|nr:DUF4133 domain-containing protein [Rhizosphaericola mali]QES88541.1 DUF4133 domain-containing protein [Rhizosphaericola mali]QES89682.1 DUF4133 domain-containing protein [Rhizosphaericola mali]